MKRAKVNYQDLSESEKALLSRTTAWRGKKRGWVFLNYRQKDFSKRDDVNFESLYSDLKLKALFICLQFNRFKRRQIYRRRGLGFQDLIQECLIAAWQLSGHPAFQYKSFQQSVMRNRLLDLAK